MGILAFLSTEGEVEKAGSISYAIDAVVSIQGSCSYGIRGLTDFNGTLQYSISDAYLDICQSLSCGCSRDFMGSMSVSSPDQIQKNGQIAYDIFNGSLSVQGSTGTYSFRDIPGSVQASSPGLVSLQGSTSYAIFSGDFSAYGSSTSSSFRDIPGSVDVGLREDFDSRGNVSLSIWGSDFSAYGSVSCALAADFPGNVTLSSVDSFQVKGYCSYNILDVTRDFKGNTQLDILGYNAVNLYGSLSCSGEDPSTSIFDIRLETDVSSMPITLSQLAISTDKESYCWAFTATADDWGAYSRMVPGEILSVKINDAVPQLFIIDERKRATSPYGEIVYSFTGRSTTALLGSGNTSTVSNTWDNCLVSEIIAELISGIPVTVSMLIDDWRLPEFSVDSQYPIDALHTLAQVTGAFLTTKDNVLVMGYKYPRSPLSIDTWPVNHNITAQDSILSLSDYLVVGDNYTEIFVADYQESSDVRISLHEIRRLSAQSCIVGLTTYPDVGEEVARSLISSSHDPARVVFTFQNTSLDTVTDTIEIISGVGSVAGTVEAIVLANYEHNADLGAVTAVNNKITTDIKAHSLLTITYVTKTYRFLLESADDKIQLIVEI